MWLSCIVHHGIQTSPFNSGTAATNPKIRLLYTELIVSLSLFFYSILASFIVGLFNLYEDLFFTYLEINPLGRVFFFFFDFLKSTITSQTISEQATVIASTLYSCTSLLICYQVIKLERGHQKEIREESITKKSSWNTHFWHRGGKNIK